jgi:hypothetical protein
VTAPPDVSVRVRSRARDEPAPVADLYRGITDVTLNGAVDVVFVPAPSDGGSLLDQSSVPWNLDEVSTPDQARRAAVFFAQYAVAPDEARAGTGQPFGHDGQLDRVLFFVSTDEFARYAEDLADLSTTLGGLRVSAPISGLRHRPAIAWLERAVLRSPLLLPGDAAALGRPQVV